jgi:serine/threonine protein kinase
MALTALKGLPKRKGLGGRRCDLGKMLIGMYKVYRVIGDGSFSTVKLGFHTFTNEPAAVKIISKHVLPADARDRIVENVPAIMRLDHPGIVKCLDFIEDEAAIYIVFEYCAGGELFDFIASRTRVEEPLAKRLFKQIILAVGYLHSQNVVHRDLKPENLLLTQHTSIKLIDFGLASFNADQPLRDRCGSTCYIAPEALTTTEYMGQPADVWALGVILYALVDGSLPWDYSDADRMYGQITTGDFPMPSTISGHCQDLLRGILNPDPSQRVTIDAILNHPWLFGVGNVFPMAKPQRTGVQLAESHRAFGRSSVSNLIAPLPVNPRPPPTSLETIFEEETMQGVLAHPEQVRQNPAVQTARTKPVQPRSVSFDRCAIVDANSDGAMSIHHGPIMSQTISHRDPHVVAAHLESTLVALGITFRKMSPLLYQLSASELQITAEVCRLAGFRDVYIISFKRLKGESWNYSQFVVSILRVFKAP